MPAFESGSDLLDRLLAKLPADRHAAVKAAFAGDEAKDAVTLLGDSALARQDYSKRMDDLRKREEELNSWYTDNDNALQDYLKIKPEYDAWKAKPPASPPPADPPPDGRKIAESVLAEQGPAYIQASAWIAAKIVQHERMFGEELDVSIFADPRLGKEIKGQPGRVVSLPDLYNEKFGEKVAAKQKEADEKRFNDEVDRRFKERLSQQQTNPFPLRGESSVLDVLAEKDGSAKHTLDTAVAEYERLAGLRG